MKRDTPEYAEMGRILERYHSAVSRLRKQLLRDVFNSGRIAGGDVEAVNEYYHMHFKQDAFNMLILRLVPKNTADNKDVGSSLCRMEDIMRSTLGHMFHEFETTVENNHLLCVFNITSRPDSQETVSFKIAIDRFFADVSADVQFNDYNIIMGEGTPVTDIMELSRSSDSALKAMEHGIVYGLNRKYDSNDLNSALCDIMSVLTPERKAVLKQSAETLKYDEVDKWIFNIFNENQSYFLDYPGLVYRLSEAILSECFYSIREISPVTLSFERELEVYHDELSRCYKVEDVVSLLQKSVRNILSFFEDLLLSHERLPVFITKGYIREHYAENLTLSYIAEQVKLNPQYLSVLFKRETGSGMIDYLQNIRMNHAKHMLRETDMPIKEIAIEVGYHDSKYFNRVFKKLMGCTPLEYKKLHAQS